jgi:hypothetical protein
VVKSESKEMTRAPADEARAAIQASVQRFDGNPGTRLKSSKRFSAARESSAKQTSSRTVKAR